LVAFDDTNNYLEITGCNVGIGTTSPATTLDVYANGTDVAISVTRGNNKDLASIFFAPAGALSASNVRFYEGLVDAANRYAIRTWNGAANAELLSILNNGNVGINDIAPAEKLDVTGNINATGVLKIDDVQVVKEQQTHIADLNAAYAAGDLDTEAEIITAINATNAKINAILAMLEAHGLVAGL